MNNHKRIVLIFFSAFFITFLLLFIHLPYNTLQIISLVLLSCLILSFKICAQSQLWKYRHILLFLATLFIFILVVSTGGFTSHFLLTGFLFALAVSFLVNLSTALIFLMLLFTILLIQLYVDIQLYQLIVTDPGVIGLFVITFLVASSLAYILNRYYHLKDVVVDLLQQKIVQKEIEEQSILSGITDLVIITSPQLEIMSINEAVERVLLLPKSEILHKPIFQVIFLKNDRESFLSHDSLPIDKILHDRQSIHREGLTLVTKNAASPDRYGVTIKPIVDVNGLVHQLLFILRSGLERSPESDKEESVLDFIITRQQAVIEEVRKITAQKGLKDLVIKMDMIGKIDREIRYILQLRSAAFQNTKSPVNIARVCKGTYLMMKDFANALNVDIEYKLLDVSAEDATSVTLADSKLSPEELTRTLYTAPVNLKWFDILVHKLVDIAVLIANRTDKSQVEIGVKHEHGNIHVSIFSSYTKLTQSESENLFKLNYDDLMTKTSLHLSSGLEGYIAQYISRKITIPIRVEITGEGIVFHMVIPMDNT